MKQWKLKTKMGMVVAWLFLIPITALIVKWLGSARDVLRAIFPSNPFTQSTQELDKATIEIFVLSFVLMGAMVGSMVLAFWIDKKLYARAQRGAN